MLEEFTTDNDFIILNSGEQTFDHSAYHLTSAIDLAVASPSIAAKCSRAAHSDLCKLSLDDSVADIEQFTSKLLNAARSSKQAP
ncbi:hypothetical protein PoB_003097800 [Plakobranchus ocellatus]|uniref:Uncharacterized protein n=1 Tax=Plakobranchus ocellatus TaxID=259542 RepID=A0AAV4ACH7_9GAST|nr:hypothetical protein PoB_003097800 [Plakobranchus ocellatus]